MKQLTDDQLELLEELRADLVATCIRLDKKRRSLTQAVWAKEYARLLAAAEPLPEGADFDMEPLAMMDPSLRRK